MSFEKQAIIAKKRELVQRYEREMLASPSGSNCESKLLDFRKVLNEMEKKFWDSRKSQEEEIHGRNESEVVENHTPGEEHAELKASLLSPNENRTNVIDESAILETQRRPSVSAISPDGLRIKIRLISPLS
ncbi:hypothetical protein CAEBREN_06357 [Caenorhabditis brenneri]|uniref:Uncharacterized protein n=1 Tax=Caenorhabditis brenneri TaxID=135651 RepID=G0MTH3_CAEBE|nr:hypothetical protein CAEBREN_06357 [Caenorhabditis brenneri]